MITATKSIFLKDIKTYLDLVVKNFDTLVIPQGKNKGIVILSLDEYNSFCATRHELSSTINEKRLDSAITKIKKGLTFSKKLIEE